MQTEKREKKMNKQWESGRSRIEHGDDAMLTFTIALHGKHAWEMLLDDGGPRGISTCRLEFQAVDDRAVPYSSNPSQSVDSLDSSVLIPKSLLAVR
jgi:hypothetical protein